MTPLDMKQLFAPYLSGKILVSEPMQNHISFRIGGQSDLFFQPADLEDLLQSLNVAKKNNIPYFVLGGGNNILVADEGISGIVVRMTTFLSAKIWHGCQILCRNCLPSLYGIVVRMTTFLSAKIWHGCQILCRRHLFS